MNAIRVQEEVIDDNGVSGLTLAFCLTPSGEGHLRVLGDLAFGNRGFVFSAKGELVGAGTALGPCPSLLRVVRYGMTSLQRGSSPCLVL